MVHYQSIKLHLFGLVASTQYTMPVTKTIGVPGPLIQQQDNQRRQSSTMHCCSDYIALDLQISFLQLLLSFLAPLNARLIVACTLPSEATHTLHFDQSPCITLEYLRIYFYNTSITCFYQTYSVYI